MKEVIDKFIDKHGHLYDYSLVEYIDNVTKVKIICKKHGIFLQTPHHHKRGGGCKKCTMGKKPLTTNEFIKKSIDKHGHLYDYSLVEYNKNRNKVKIICKKHGIFSQNAAGHMNGQGCPECGKRTSKKEKLLERFNNKHNNIYEYNFEKDEYLIDEYLKIKCKKHGYFRQKISNHLISGCQKCAGKIENREDFKKRGFEKHGNIYDYSNVDYIKHNLEVDIICKKHGVFSQKPYLHFSGSGCPHCNESRGEKKIRKYLIENKIEFISQKKFENCKHKRSLIFDFFIPFLNICIEYNGRQHYEIVNKFGGISYLEDIKVKDDLKVHFCEQNGIELLTIKYTEYKIIEEILNTKFLQFV